jgi:hypothetical protein
MDVSLGLRNRSQVAYGSSAEAALRTLHTQHLGLRHLYTCSTDMHRYICIYAPTRRNVAGMDRRLVQSSLQRYNLQNAVTQAQIAVALSTNERDLSQAFTDQFDSMSRMTADNKAYGYDSMPFLFDQGFTLSVPPPRAPKQCSRRNAHKVEALMLRACEPRAFAGAT